MKRTLLEGVQSVLLPLEGFSFNGNSSIQATRTDLNFYADGSDKNAISKIPCHELTGYNENCSHLDSDKDIRFDFEQSSRQGLQNSNFETCKQVEENNCIEVRSGYNSEQITDTCKEDICFCLHNSNDKKSIVVLPNDKQDSVFTLQKPESIPDSSLPERPCGLLFNQKALSSNVVPTGRRRFPKSSGITLSVPPLKLPPFIMTPVDSNCPDNASSAAGFLGINSDFTSRYPLTRSLAFPTTQSLCGDNKARNYDATTCKDLSSLDLQAKILNKSLLTTTCNTFYPNYHDTVAVNNSFKKQQFVCVDNSLHYDRIQHLFMELKKVKICTSLTGRKPAVGFSENQDACFTVAVNRLNADDACCHGVCDGHGKGGSLIASAVAHIMEGAFSFLIQSFITLIESKRRTGKICFDHRLLEREESISGRDWVCETPDYQSGIELGKLAFGDNELRNIIRFNRSVNVEEFFTIDTELFKNAIRGLFRSIEAHVENIPSSDKSGCTVAMLLRLGAQAWIIWVGDSKVVGYEYGMSVSDRHDEADYIAVQTNSAQHYLSHFHGQIDRYIKSPTLQANFNVQLRFHTVFETQDHCPFTEIQRIRLAGGVVSQCSTHLQRPTYRLHPTGIAMSRSLGDVASSTFGLIHEPDMVCLKIPWRGFEAQNHTAKVAVGTWAFVIGTDGLWDTVSTKEVAKDLIAGIFIDVIETYAAMAESSLEIHNDDSSSLEKEETGDESDECIDFWDASNNFYLDYHVQSLSLERATKVGELAQKRRERLEGFSDDVSVVICFLI